MIINKQDKLIPIDIIHTPYDDYFVTYYKNTEKSSYVIDDRFIWTLSGKNNSGLYEAIKLFTNENPDVVVEAKEQNPGYERIDTPGGKIGEILSEKNLVAIATQKYQLYREFEEDEGNTDKIISLEKYLKEDFEALSKLLRKYVWVQLVRQSSVNDLIYENDLTPRHVLTCGAERGFVIIDSELEANCGYGRGNLRFYEVVRRDTESKDNPGPFPRTTAYVKNTINTWIQRLSAANMQSESLKEIVSSGKYVQTIFDGHPAVIFKTPEMSSLDKIVGLLNDKSKE